MKLDVCPLRAIATDRTVGRVSPDCIKSKCAWWAGEGCAVKVIADNLNDIRLNSQPSEMEGSTEIYNIKP